MPTQRFRCHCALLAAGLLVLLMSWPAAAQTELAPPTPAPCAADTPNAGKVMMPPVGSGPVYRNLQLTFPKQGDISSIEPATYLYYIQALPSRPCQTGTFVAWDERT